MADDNRNYDSAAWMLMRGGSLQMEKHLLKLYISVLLENYHYTQLMNSSDKNKKYDNNGHNHNHNKKKIITIIMIISIVFQTSITV